MTIYTAKEKCDAIGRELVYRRRVYKRLVQLGKMKMEAAMYQIAVFEAIEADYAEKLPKTADLFPIDTSGDRYDPQN